MAAALFTSYADPTRALAFSAGTEPAVAVHPNVVASMREVGVDLSSASTTKLTPELAAGVDLLVTMGCGESCPIIPGQRRLDWAIADPKGRPVSEVHAIRDEIAARVRMLVKDEGWLAEVR
jgi:arsenate reductase